MSAQAKHEPTFGPWLSASDYRTRFYFPGGGMTVLPEFTLTMDGKAYRFDWHNYLGPTFLRKDGEPLARYPSERHPMWKAFGAWERQGKRVDMAGNCIWEPEPPEPKPVLRHIRGRHFEIIGWEQPAT